MRIASYLVGYDSQGNLCHLVVDNLPLVAKTYYGDLRRRDIAGRNSREFDLFVLGAGYSNALCLPELPQVVVTELEAGRSLSLVDLASGREVQLQCPSALVRAS